MPLFEESFTDGFLLFVVPAMLILLLSKAKWLKAYILQIIALLYVVLGLIWMYFNYETIPSVTFIVILVAGWLLFMIGLTIIQYFTFKWHGKPFKAYVYGYNFINPYKYGHQFSDVVFTLLIISGLIIFPLIASFHWGY